MRATVRPFRVLGLATFAGLWAAAPVVAAPAERHFTLIAGSQVGYHVVVKTLGLLVESIDGDNEQVNGEVRLPAAGQPAGWAEAAIAGFHSGIGSRDRHVAKLLGAPAMGTVRYTLDRLEGFDARHPAGQAIAIGRLAANGRTASVRVPLRYQFAGRTLRIDGEAPVRFADFGIQPPMMGFVLKRAPDQLAIRLHLVASEVGP